MKLKWVFPKLRRLFSLQWFPLYSTSEAFIRADQINYFFSYVEMSRLLSDCAREGKLLQGSTLHASMVKICDYYDPREPRNYRNCIVAWNSLLAMYSKNRAMEEAVKVFEEMPVRDTVSWNSIVSGFLSNGNFRDGFIIFKQMHESGIDHIDHATFSTVLSFCGASHLIGLLSMIHGLVFFSGYVDEITVGNALITAYFECGCPHRGEKVFNETSERNVVTWTAVISGLAQNQFYEDCVKLFKEMHNEFVIPNSLTYLSLLSACSGLQALRVGQQIHARVLQLGVHSGLCMESALMDMYSKCGVMEDALQLFYSTSKLDDVSMTIILAGFAQNGLEDKAIQLFLKMVKGGVDIDSNMVSAVLGVFGADTSLSFGQQLHSLATKKRFISNPFVSNGLINMYSKCGVLEEASKIFNRMPLRNSVSWNSVIAAFARHGDGFQALQLYEEMVAEGIEPTDVTFLSLLHACSHVGLVSEGMEFIQSMSKVHGITPRMEHYACIVDMLGRAGLLKEAETFIEELPTSPGALVWQALLGACGIHGDSEMGTFAAEKLFSLAPDSPSPYILLANIYSSRGKWRERAKTIKRMKETGIAKETGVSCIEIEKRMHSFVVRDQLHPRSELIYGVLMELLWHMRDEGYVPDIRYVLHYLGPDIEEGQDC